MATKGSSDSNSVPSPTSSLIVMPSQASPSQAAASSKVHNSSGIISGVVLGGLVVVALLLGLILCKRRRGGGRNIIHRSQGKRQTSRLSTEAFSFPAELGEDISISQLTVSATTHPTTPSYSDHAFTTRSKVEELNVPRKSAAIQEQIYLSDFD